MKNIALTLIAIAVTSSTAAFAQFPPIFVNEIHYDNSGTDVGEFIEVLGLAGSDLTDWTIVLYNGGSPYSTQTLSGTIPNQVNGYGVVFVSYPTNGIQNGPQDGIALVDETTGVVQFLSYEGVITPPNTPAGGPAAGLTSMDIGVAETGTEPAGQSLQVIILNGSFTWANGTGDASPGMINAKELFSAPLYGDYNSNGIVDAADYVLWRNGGPLQNDPTAGVDSSDYTYWRSRFGATTGSGSGAGDSTVPETSAIILASLCVAAFSGRRYAR